jgi:hypothetical protein
MQPSVLQAAGFADREESLHGAVAMIGLRSVARPPPHHRMPERSLRGVVRGRHTGDPGECPERLIALQKPGAEPRSLRVAATSALLQQCLDLLARVARAARSAGSRSGVLRILNTSARHAWSLRARWPGAPARSPSAMKSRSIMRETQLALSVIDVRGRRRSGQTRSPRRDRRPAAFASTRDPDAPRSERGRPRRHRRQTDSGYRRLGATRSHPRNAPAPDRDARGSGRMVVQRLGGLRDQGLDRRDAELDTAQVLQQAAGLTPRDTRRGQRRGGRRQDRAEHALRHPGRQRRERSIPTPATGARPPVLTHLDHHLDLTDLMTHRLADRDPRSDSRRLSPRRDRRPQPPAL